MTNFKNLSRILLLTITVFSLKISAEDYQYHEFQRDSGEGFLPFSDYIPRVKKHYYTTPHFLEDYYLLYSMKQHYNENTLRLNIALMNTALNSKFRHPSQAFIKINSEDEYYKYRNIMFMHINLLICRDYRRIALRYDRRKIYFYDDEHADMLVESLTQAKELYIQALPYWEETKKYAERASDIKITLDMGTIETERFNIIKGNLDMEKHISRDIAKVEEKLVQLERMRNNTQAAQ